MYGGFSPSARVTDPSKTQPPDVDSLSVVAKLELHVKGRPEPGADRWGQQSGVAIGLPGTDRLPFSWLDDHRYPRSRFTIATVRDLVEARIVETGFPVVPLSMERLHSFFARRPTVEPQLAYELEFRRIPSAFTVWIFNAHNQGALQWSSYAKETTALRTAGRSVVGADVWLADAIVAAESTAPPSESAEDFVYATQRDYVEGFWTSNLVNALL